MWTKELIVPVCGKKQVLCWVRDKISSEDVFDFLSKELSFLLEDNPMYKKYISEIKVTKLFGLEKTSSENAKLCFVVEIKSNVEGFEDFLKQSEIDLTSYIGFLLSSFLLRWYLSLPEHYICWRKHVSEVLRPKME